MLPPPPDGGVSPLPQNQQQPSQLLLPPTDRQHTHTQSNQTPLHSTPLTRAPEAGEAQGVRALDVDAVELRDAQHDFRQLRVVPPLYREAHLFVSHVWGVVGGVG